MLWTLSSISISRHSVRDAGPCPVAAQSGRRMGGPESQLWKSAEVATLLHRERMNLRIRPRGEQADCGEASLARRNNPKEFVSVRTAAKRARERVSLGLCSPERVTPLPT